MRVVVRLLLEVSCLNPFQPNTWDYKNVLTWYLSNCIGNESGQSFYTAPSWTTTMTQLVQVKIMVLNIEGYARRVLTLSDGGMEEVLTNGPADAVTGTYSLWFPVGFPEAGLVRNVYK